MWHSVINENSESEIYNHDQSLIQTTDKLPSTWEGGKIICLLQRLPAYTHSSLLTFPNKVSRELILFMPSLFKGQFSLEKGGLQVYLSVREKQRFQPPSKRSNSTHGTSGLSGRCSTPSSLSSQDKCPGKLCGGISLGSWAYSSILCNASLWYGEKNAYLPKQPKSCINI